MLYTNIIALGLVVSEEMSFRAIVEDARRTTHDKHDWLMAIAKNGRLCIERFQNKKGP